MEKELVFKHSQVSFGKHTDYKLLIADGDMFLNTLLAHDKEFKNKDNLEIHKFFKESENETEYVIEIYETKK